MMANSTTETITLVALCEDLAISPKTVRRMIKSGRIPKPMRLNGVAFRWLRSDVRLWLELGMPTASDFILVKSQREASV